MRRFISCAILLLLVVSLSISAVAHPGRTDAKGGHWNRSTGEYHYHHGYSAHDHYDMNGDGIVDCPYSFKKVETSISESSIRPIKSNSKLNKMIEEYNQKKEKSKKTEQMLSIVCLLIFNVIFVIPLVISRLSK